MDKLTGQEVKGNHGVYIVDRLIARGGRSNILRAVSKERQEFVCIKVLTTWLDDSSIKQLQREEAITSKLRHPNVIRIFDTGEFEGRFCTIMELAADGSLADRLKIDRPMPLTAILPIVDQIASALNYVHRQGIIHKDIKPGNILLDGERAILSDFGIARVMGEQIITATSSAAGSVVYMSPEQARGDSINEKSDQYSLAVVVFEMLTGQVPFFGSNPMETVYRIVQSHPPSIRERNPQVPTSAEQVVLKALNKNPAHRYETVLEFANALSRASRFTDDPRELRPDPEEKRSNNTRTVDKSDLFTLALVASIGAFLGAFAAILLIALLAQFVVR